MLYLFLFSLIHTKDYHFVFYQINQDEKHCSRNNSEVFVHHSVNGVKNEFLFKCSWKEAEDDLKSKRILKNVEDTNYRCNGKDLLKEVECDEVQSLNKTILYGVLILFVIVVFFIS